MNDLDFEQSNVTPLMSPTVQGTSEMSEYGKKFSFKK